MLGKFHCLFAPVFVSGMPISICSGSSCPLSVASMRNHTFSLVQSCAQQYDNNSVGSMRGRRQMKTGVDSGEISHKRFDDEILLIDRPCTENHGRRETVTSHRSAGAQSCCASNTYRRFLVYVSPMTADYPKLGLYA